MAEEGPLEGGLQLVKNQIDQEKEALIAKLNEQQKELTDLKKNIEMKAMSLDPRKSLDTPCKGITVEDQLINTIFSEDLSVKKGADSDIRRVIEKEMLYFENERSKYESKYRIYKIVITTMLVLINILQILGMLTSSAVAIWFEEHANKVCYYSMYRLC